MAGDIFYQLFESETFTYTYLLGDRQSGGALLIDPVLETMERDLQLIGELGLKLRWICETHIHADHVTGAAELRRRTGAKIAVAKVAQAVGVDIPLVDGDEIGEGAVKLKVLATPGHTDSCLSYYRSGMVFTGDALTIRGCGRTDFQQGSASGLYQSITNKLFTLPDDTKVYPAHDYTGMTASTIALEKRFNRRLGDGKTEAMFTKIMAELKLAPPKRIKVAVPANMRLGEIQGGKNATSADGE